MRVPAMHLERHEDRQHQNRQAQSVTRHKGESVVADHQQAPIKRFRTTAKIMVFCTPMLGIKIKPPAKAPSNRADGIGRIGTADAAADLIKTLGEQARDQGKGQPSSTVGMNITSAERKICSQRKTVKVSPKPWSSGQRSAAVSRTTESWQERRGRPTTRSSRTDSSALRGRQRNAA